MPYTFPIVEYKHSQNNCASITGGFVYRGWKYPKMYGMYIYNDYCTGKYSVVFKDNQTWLNIFLLDEEDGEYVSFGEDSKGELYAVDLVTGEIERVIDASETPGIAENPNYKPDIANLKLKLSPNPNKGQFTVELIAPKNETYSIFVTNVVGATVLSLNKPAVKGINTWSLSSPKLQKGVYLLHVQSSNASITQNFIVDK